MLNLRNGENDWHAWAEYSYNTSRHSSIKTTHFAVVYGHETPSLLMYILGRAKVDAVDNQPRARDEVLKELKENIRLAQG